MLALMEQLNIFKKLSQKAGVKAKPQNTVPDDPVFTRIDKEIDEIRYGNVEGGLSAANINGLKAHFPEFYQVKFMEDNQASITVMGTGNSSTMRYANKTQNICFKWMKQQFEEEQFDLINVGTLWQTADILTKPFTSPTKWEHALRWMSIGKSWIDDADGKVRQVAKTPACAANVKDQGGDEVPTSYQRLLIEFCCSEDSKLCTPRAASKGCRLIRVTENDDGTTKGCRNWIAQQVQSFREDNPQGEILLYASLPCVGGSPWGNVNGMTEVGAERIEQQQKDFTKLFKSFQKLVHEIDGPHFSIAFELSKNCKYWKWPMVQAFLKRYDLKQHVFHGCQFGVTDNEGLPMKKGWMIATNMDELSGLSKYICDDSHTHGQSRGKALKLAENYTFSLTDFIHTCFRSRASSGDVRTLRKRLAVPAMSTSSKMYNRALASAGLAAVPQQSNMSEYMAFRRYLDVVQDQVSGWEDIFQTVLGSATILSLGNQRSNLELASGMTQIFTSQSVCADMLESVPWAVELQQLAELTEESTWDLDLPREYVPGTSRPTVDVVPAVYVLTTDSTLALITGKGKTIKKYTLEKDFEARKSGMILEIAHDMRWGKDLQDLCKANIAKVREIKEKYREQYGERLRIYSVIVWSGNELCGKYGIEPLPMWGQDSPEGSFPELMERVQGNLVWWNRQLKELGVDQAALVGEPDHIVYGLGMVFTTFLDRLKVWYDENIAPDNERLRWIKNDKLPARVELKDLFHAFDTEENRMEMLGYYMSVFHLLHVTDILIPQYNRSSRLRFRLKGVAVPREKPVQKQNLPIAIQELLQALHEKVMTPAPLIVEAKPFTKDEVERFPPEASDLNPYEYDDDPWAAVDVNEFEGPSVGRAKASHAAPEPPAKTTAEAPSSSAAPAKAALVGEPGTENVEDGTIFSKFARGHVEKWLYKFEEDINGQVAEHVVTEGHPFELIQKTCWEMDGADRLKYPARLWEHRTKVNAVTRGHQHGAAGSFDDEMWLDLEDFFKGFCGMLPKKIQPLTVAELVALLHRDNKCRFEFKCIAGLQKATLMGLTYWPFKIRAVQGHTKKSMARANASSTFNATMVYARTGADALAKAAVVGKPIITAESTPGMIYHRTNRGNWKSIVKNGFIPGGGDRVSSGRAHNYFSEVQVKDKEYVSGLRAERPVEIRVAMREAVTAGIVFIRTASDGILTTEQVPSQFIVSVDDTERGTNLYRRSNEVAVEVQEYDIAVSKVQGQVKALEGKGSSLAKEGAKEVVLKPRPPELTAGLPGYASSRAQMDAMAKQGIELPKPEPAKAPMPKLMETTSKAAAIGPKEPSTPPPAKAPPPKLPPAKAIPKESSAPPPKAEAKQPVEPPKTAPLPKPPTSPPPKASLTGAPTQKEVVKVEQMKVETGQCPKCYAETLKGQISCDLCGHILEDAAKADRKRIAERRRQQLQKFGLRYDSKGEFLQQITEEQLTSLGILNELLFRGNISPEAELLARARGRHTRAEKLGFRSVLERFTSDAQFAQSLLAEGESEYDCERYDVLRHGHLPKTDRISAQIQLGVSENSMMEHTAMRLVFLDIEGKHEIPDRFHYLGKPWLFMYRTEVYSQEEYIDYLHRNPTHNLLMSNTGLDRIDMTNPKGHIEFIINKNHESYKKVADEKKKQSVVSKEKNEAKRKAEATSAYGQTPSKRGTVSSVSQSSSSARGSGDRAPYQGSSRDEKVYTGEWQWYQGAWYQKVIRYGRTEWEAY